MPDGSVTNLLADGTLAFRPGARPRFGMLAPLISSQTVKTPGGLISTTATASAVTLSNAADPLSLISLTTQHPLTAVSRRRLHRSNRTVVATSAAGRQSFTRVDASGRTMSGDSWVGNALLHLRPFWPAVHRHDWYRQCHGADYEFRLRCGWLSVRGHERSPAM